MNKYDEEYVEALIKENQRLREENKELKTQIDELSRFTEESGN